MNAENEIPPPQPQVPAGLGLPIATLILGIISVCLSFLVVGVVVGFVGIVLGIVSLRKPGGLLRHMAWAGLMLSIVGFVLSSIFGITYYNQYRELTGGDRERTENAMQDWEGVVAPDFKVTTIDGKKIQLSELKGKRVVVDLWATWCGPCVEQIPEFNRLKEESSDQDLVILGISSEDEQTVKEFSKKKSIKYLISSAKDLPAPYSQIEAYPTAFFIDRKGTIQHVTEGYHDFEDLVKLAKGEDYHGVPQTSPRSADALSESEKMLKPVPVATHPVSDPLGICSADWNGDGSEEILVSDDRSIVHVFSADGQEIEAIPVPGRFAVIEAGRHRTDGVRLLGYSTWGDQVVAMNAKGYRIWAYNTQEGVNGAHWGDIDGDGSDEMIIGMNGGGGIHIVSPEGKLIQSIKDIGNVWSQAVIPAAGGRPAMICATEAGGSVRIYDVDGKRIHEMAPLGQYYAKMSATVSDAKGTVQIIAASESVVAAFDETGKLAWKTSAKVDDASWRAPAFAHADLDKDGAAEWFFRTSTSELVVVSSAGMKLASVKTPVDLRGFATCTDSKGRVVLALLLKNSLQLERFE